LQPVKTKTAHVDGKNFGQLIRELREPLHEATEGTEGTLPKLVSTNKPEQPDRVPGGKRSARFQRKYAKAVKAIEGGEIKPEVKPVATHVNCSTRTASSILSKAVESDGRFSRDARGRIAFAT